MGQTGNMVRQVVIKSDGEVFYEIFRDRPHDISTMSPGNVQGVDLLEGDWGTVGSVISWSYTHEGKKKITKAIVEAIDEENKIIRFKVTEGDLTELHKTFVFILQVDIEVENSLVTWTLEYEKLNDSVEDPNTMMDFCIELSRDIDAYKLQQ